MKLGSMKWMAAGACLGVLALAVIPAHAETVGFPLVNRGFDGDVVTGVDAILLQGFSQTGTLTSWSFFSNRPDIALPVTPFLATRTGTDTFNIISIGTTRTNAGTGIQSFDFGATIGTPTVDSNTFFGFHSGTVNTGTNGAIELDTLATSNPQFALRTGSNSITTGAGTFTPFSDNRVYSLQAVSMGVSVVPEGSTAALLGLALPMIGTVVVARRRSKK